MFELGSYDRSHEFAVFADRDSLIREVDHFEDVTLFDFIFEKFPKLIDLFANLASISAGYLFEAVFKKNCT